MKYIIYCVGVDFYAHIAETNDCQDYENYISFDDGSQMQALADLANVSPQLLEYFEYKDMLFK